MTTETLILLRDLLDTVQMSAGHPDFEDSALRLIQAKRELRDALDARSTSAPNADQEASGTTG